MKRRCLFILFAVAISAAGGSAQDAKGIKVVPRNRVQAERARRWAVLIGVDAYEDETGIGSLKYCGRDMKLLRRVLTGPNGGFAADNVLLMTNDAPEPNHRPTYSNIVTMVKRWLEDAQPGDDVLVAFSGHGITERGEAYLLPSTAKRGNLRMTAVPVGYIRERLEACKAERKILIVDACHSGAGKDAPAMDDAFKRELERGKGFVKLASCGPEQKSNEDGALESAVGKGHGVFSYYLAEALEGKGDRDSDGRVDVDEAYRYAFANTAGWARRKGLRQDPMKSGSVTGVMTIGYYRTLNDLQRDRAAAEARLKQLRDRSNKAGDDAARKAIAEAWEKERKALEELERRLRELDAGASDADSAVKAYHAAKANVESIERELAKKRQEYTPASSVVRTLERSLEQAKEQLDTRRKAAVQPLLAKLEALERQQKAMAREMLPANPKMKQVATQVASVRTELLDIGWRRPPLELQLGGGVTMRLVFIPPGEFMMGSPANEKDRSNDEGPQHRVGITQGFYMAATEVTQAQYEAVMGKNPARFKGANNPVECVSWNDCVEFCRRLSAKAGQTVRLPTEAEWEYACRAGTTTRFCFGSNDGGLDDYAWHSGNSGSKTHPVGRKKPNAFGLYDMHGNVWEWCQSLSKPYPYRVEDGREDRRSAGSRVLRGGSWNLTPRRCRSAYRGSYDPSGTYAGIGFRIVVPVVVQEFN